MALSPCNTVTDPSGRELNRHGTPLFPVACYHENLSLDEVPWHWHDELELILVEKGTLVISVEGKSRFISEGGGCFINAGALHSVWEEKPQNGTLRSLVFHPRLVGGSLDSIFWQSYLQPLLANIACRFIVFDRQIPWNREALEAIADAWRACVTEPPGYEFTVRERLSRAVFFLTEHCPAVHTGPSEKSLRDTERIKIMLQYIQDRYSEPLTTADIARSAAVSESECLRCFRAMIGTAPIQYVRRLRIQRAEELLQFTDRKISDIGASCGFQEMSYFAKTFRELKGCTPREYRRQRQNR